MGKKNKALRAEYYDKYCIICGLTPCDPAHIRNFAVTLKDEPHNIVALCRRHHSEQHSSGRFTFINKHPEYKKHIESLGWEVFNGVLVYSR